MEKDYPFTVTRPWGEFRQFNKGEPSTVKVIFIKKGESLSLQHHHLRQEFWKILSGTPQISIGDKVIGAKKGDEFFVGKEVDHRMSAPNDDVEVLEISTGEFDENDIVRTEDNYGRA